MFWWTLLGFPACGHCRSVSRAGGLGQVSVCWIPPEVSVGRKVIFADGAAPEEFHVSLFPCFTCAADRYAKSSPICWLRTDLLWGTRGPTPSWSPASRAA